jgi:Xaa-Pro dipeptidase
MSLYQHHLQTLLERYRQACDQFALGAIALHSGSLTYYTNDDNAHPFHPMPLTQQWLPFDLMPEAWLIISKDSAPTLIWPDRPDFWHVTPKLTEGDWQQHWKIVKASQTSISALLPKPVAVLSHQPDGIDFIEPQNVNPVELLNWLNFDRAVKTEWEIEQLRIASQRAVRGHRAAKEAFLSGLCEYDIHLAYLRASKQQQLEEPYGSIVALNEGAAVLHYENKHLEAPKCSNTLLIDAGAKINGYASDITRTFTQGNDFFLDLVKAVDALQLRLCQQCTVGTNYLDIHNSALQEIAALLHQSGLCKLGVEEQLAKKVTQTFFPHGIGHLLGLNVHDAGGLQQNRQGDLATRPEHAPFLRLMRPLQNNTVVTIEPGLYFIPMLLEKMIAEIPEHGCDLKLIETLKPFGGIRIEDNVVAKAEGTLNLTRTSFEEINFSDS